ncbi:MAG: hypothetical protein R6W95_16485 [Desulfosarcina sp.]|jgi:hypothetical protein
MPGIPRFPHQFEILRFRNKYNFGVALHLDIAAAYPKYTSLRVICAPQLGVFSKPSGF